MREVSILISDKEHILAGYNVDRHVCNMIEDLCDDYHAKKSKPVGSWLHRYLKWLGFAE
jgi:hypothetical protein